MERGLKSRHSDHPGTLQWTWQILHLHNRKYYRLMATLIPECHRLHQTTAPNVSCSSSNFLKQRGKSSHVLPDTGRSDYVSLGEEEREKAQRREIQGSEAEVWSVTVQCSAVPGQAHITICCTNASTYSADTINEVLHRVACPPGDGLFYKTECLTDWTKALLKTQTHLFCVQVYFIAPYLNASFRVWMKNQNS